VLSISGPKERDSSAAARLQTDTPNLLKPEAVNLKPTARENAKSWKQAVPRKANGQLPASSTQLRNFG
jgi:hypothetical protein